MQILSENIITKLKTWQARVFFVTLLICIILSFIFLQSVLIYHIGLLEEIFGINYQLFQIINICFKIFASMTLFILIAKIFKDYLSFLLNGPKIIVAAIILSLSFLGLRKRLTFFLSTFFINLTLGILIFFVATHNLMVPSNLRLNFDVPRIYSTLVGIFILVLAFVYYLEWQFQNKKDMLLMAIWSGPFVAFLFITLTWMLADINLGFGGAQDHYLLMPTFGIYMFLAGLLVIIYNKTINIKNILPKLTLYTLMFSFIFTFYYFNKQLITSYFNAASSEGRAAKDQQMIQSKL